MLELPKRLRFNLQDAFARNRESQAEFLDRLVQALDRRDAVVDELIENGFEIVECVGATRYASRGACFGRDDGAGAFHRRNMLHRGAAVGKRCCDLGFEPAQMGRRLLGGRELRTVGVMLFIDPGNSASSCSG